MKIVVIDGQGGKMGSAIVTLLKAEGLANIFALGTNSVATSAMLKAGADIGATGENPVLVNTKNADIIIGPLGIVMADALHGEITPAMAAAVGTSGALRILIPTNRCNTVVAGVEPLSLTDYVRLAVKEVKAFAP